MECDINCCPVCLEGFDLSEHLPRLTNVCGHSICSSCLRELLKTQSVPRCPLDKLCLSTNISFDKYPVNITLRQLIEKKINKKLCQIHKKEVTFICTNDNQQICNDCVEDHQAKSHKLTNLNTLQEKIILHKNKIANLLNDINTYRLKSLKILDECKMTRIQKIKEKSNEMRKLIEEKEKELIFETEALIDLEKAQIERILGQNSQLVQETSKRYSELSRFLEDQSFLLSDPLYFEIEKYVKKWKNKLESKAAHIKMAAGFRKMDEMLDSCFKEKEIFGYGSGVPLLDPLQSLIGTFSEGMSKNTIEWDPNVGITHFENLNCLQLKYTTDSLTIISDPDNIIKEQQINSGTPNILEEIILIVKKEIPEKDIEVLKYIWEKIKGTVNIYLELTPSVVTEELYNVLKGGSLTFSSIEINLDGCEIKDNCKSLPLISSIISKGDNLVSLSINLSKANFLSSGLGAILKMSEPKFTYLEHFSLDLRNASVTDDDISQFFIALPFISKYLLFLSNTKITDETLELCAKNTLSSATFLKEFGLHLEGVPVTDCGLTFIFKSLQNKTLEKLGFIFDSVEISDKSLDLLSSTLTRSLTSFQMVLGVAKITSPGLCKIFKPLKNLKHLFLDLSNYKIDDDIFKRFVSKSLVSMKCLETLLLSFVKTDITDAGVIEIIKHLPENLTQMELNLDSNKITDYSIYFFLENKMSNMKKLKNVEISVKNCFVSEDLQNNLQSTLAKKIQNIDKRKSISELVVPIIKYFNILTENDEEL